MEAPLFQDNQIKMFRGNNLYNLWCRGTNNHCCSLHQARLKFVGREVHISLVFSYFWSRLWTPRILIILDLSAAFGTVSFLIDKLSAVGPSRRSSELV